MYDYTPAFFWILDSIYATHVILECLGQEMNMIAIPGWKVHRDKSRVSGGCQGEMESCLKDLEFLFYKMKSPGDWLHNCMKVLNTTELHT